MTENVKKYMRLCRIYCQERDIEPHSQATIDAKRAYDEAYASLTQEDIQQFIGWVG